jgi:DNA-binding transcriptional MocR family regulator
MSLRRREQLVRLARQFDALIVTDDVYDMLQWPNSPDAPSKVLDRAYLPRIVDVDRDLDGGPADKWGNSISNGSFSKIVAPGCRTGWVSHPVLIKLGAV